MRRLPHLVALGIAILVAAPRVQAQTTVSADDAVWQVNVHVERLFASPLGAMINDVIHKEAPDGKLNVDALVEAMGMDLRTAIKEVAIFGNGFEPTSLHAVVANIGSTRGNIEGWLLAAPGYKSETIDDSTILHSFVMEDHGPNARLWCAIPFSKSTNSHILVAATERDTVVALAKQAAEQGIGKFGDKLSGDTLVSLAVNDLSKAPIEIDEDEPGSAIIKTIQTIVFSATSEGDQLVATCEIDTDNPARAQQLNQLITGMKAMVQLALPEKNPEGEQLAKMLSQLNVAYTEGSTTLSAKFAVDYAQIREFAELKHHLKHDVK
jgi:hypothetical protein